MKIHFNCLSFLLGAGLWLAASAVSAQVIEKVTAPELRTMLLAEGYAATIDDDGDVEWKIEGSRCYLLVLNNGKSILFKTSFRDTDATLQKVNRWNQTKRYSRAYLDEDGDPVLELDLDLVGGATKARIIDYFRTCFASFKAWHEEVVK